MKLKYVICKNGNFAIFTTAEAHNDMARAMEGQPVGAGFCDISIGYEQKSNQEVQIVNVHCYGGSVSLGIASRTEDEGIINNFINNYY